MGGNTDGGNRTKAYRLRLQAQKGELTPVDRLWLADYEEKIQRARNERRNAINHAAQEERGASRSKRTVHLDIDEEKEAAGTGPTAAAIAAGAALEAKEEGRRLDALTINSMEMMSRAVDTYERITGTLERHWGIVVTALTQSMKKTRDQHSELAESDAEILTLKAQLAAALEAKENGGSSPEDLLLAVLKAHSGTERNGESPATRKRPSDG